MHDTLEQMHISFGDFLGAMTMYEMLDTFSISPSTETFANLIEVAANSTPHACEPATSFFLLRKVNVNLLVHHPSQS